VTSPPVLIDVADNIARVTLNRPDAANAINLDLARELLGVAIRCDRDPAIRAVVLSGAGRMFCAGGDLRTMAAFGEEIGAGLKELTTYLHAAVAHFARMNAPLVVAVNGIAAGAGMSLAVAGDFVVAAESAGFLMAYTAAGLVPDGSSTYFLPRLIGLRRTAELMLTNRRLSAREAMDWGLVNRVVPDDGLGSEALALARELAEGPTRTFGAVKRLLQDSCAATLETQMEMESRAIAEMAASSDGREGVSAFVEKRRPNFTGR
jgi:2-(1,2-epoxy-1,2-dihydrophenyl)acetyl-CoA isomerase